METADNVLLQMREFCSGEMLDIEKLNAVFSDYMKNGEQYRSSEAEYLAFRGLTIIRCSGRHVRDYCLYYYLMTFLLKATNNREVYKELLQYCIKDQTITKENKFFLYHQFESYNFLQTEIMDDEIMDAVADLYDNIYQAYKNQLREKMQAILKEERKQEFVMVISSQVLGVLHAPTKVMLDYCYILEEDLHKKVYIVNTAECLTSYRSIPCFAGAIGNYIEEYSETGVLHYRGKSFAFFQCPQQMPDVSVIEEILNVVESEKPYFILTIGDSLVSDLCSNIVPTISVPLSADRTMTYGRFQAIGRKITENDRKWIRKHGLPPDHMIEILPTYNTFEESGRHFTRQELGVPEKQFVIVLVGNRLDQEISSECMDMLCQLAEMGICVAFVGGFNRYGKYAYKNMKFKNNSVNLGYQSDLLAVYECVDLFVNPKRLGGGTSAAMALYKGLPVVTFDYGDIGSTAGADFHVSDYDDMRQQILRYSHDREYYREMCEKARERASQIINMKEQFLKVIRQAEMSEYF